MEARLQRLEKQVEELTRKSDAHVHFADTVTGVVGLREAFTTECRALRYLWTLLFVIGVGATAFFVYLSVHEYLASPMSTAIKLNVSAAFDLPLIGLCPSAWMDIHKTVASGLSGAGLKYSIGYVDRTPNMKSDELPEGKSEFIDFYNARNFSSLLQYLEWISLDLDTIYSTHQMNTSMSAVRLSDNRTKLLGRAFLTYQICNIYQYRPTDRSTQSMVSTTAQFFDKTNGVVEFTPGLWVKLGFENFLGYKFPSFFLPSHTRSKITISTKRFITLNKPSTPCKRKHELVGKYSSTACVTACQNEFYKKIIKCRMFRYSSFDRSGPPLDYCNLFEQIREQYKNIHIFEASAEHKDFTQICLKKCPPLCDRVTYQGLLQWQQALTKSQIGNSSDKNRILVSFAIEHVGKYEGETVTLHEKHAYTFPELVSNVGGTFGLFVGATVMTFVQLVAYFLGWLHRKLRRKATKL